MWWFLSIAIVCVTIITVLVHYIDSRRKKKDKVK